MSQKPTYSVNEPRRVPPAGEEDAWKLPLEQSASPPFFSGVIESLPHAFCDTARIRRGLWKHKILQVSLSTVRPTASKERLSANVCLPSELGLRSRHANRRPTKRPATCNATHNAASPNGKSDPFELRDSLTPTRVSELARRASELVYCNALLQKCGFTLAIFLRLFTSLSPKPQSKQLPKTTNKRCT